MMVFVTRPAGAPPPPPPDVTAPDLLDGEVGIYGLCPTSYLLGWPKAYDAVGVTEYEYSLNGGSTWTSAGTNVYAYISGRSASSTDQVRVRAIDAASNVSAQISRDVTLPASDAVLRDIITVGTGGDYSTPQAAVDSLGSLVAANRSKDILLLLQEWTDTSGVTLLDIDGKTTDATRRLRISAFPGCSFADHANRRTNPLRYNAAVGAALKALRNANQLPTVDIKQGYVQLDRLQVLSTPLPVGSGGTGYGGGWGVHTSSPTQPVVMEQCIVESSNYDFVESFNFGPSGNPHVLSRCAIISNRPAGSPTAMDRIGESGQGDIQHHSCIFVAVGQRAAQAHAGKQPTIYFENCGFFGVDAVQNFEGDNIILPGPTYVDCYSDAPGTLPTGVTFCDFSTTLGAKFVDITSGGNDSPTHDLRIQAGSDLIGAGTVNATYSARDITGKQRGAAPDVGPWQT